MKKLWAVLTAAVLLAGACSGDHSSSGDDGGGGAGGPGRAQTLLARAARRRGGPPGRGATAVPDDALDAAPLTAAQGEHTFGQADGRDPLIVDPTVNVLSVHASDDDATIATVVQWASHPETTLGWDPPGDFTEECAAKG